MMAIATIRNGQMRLLMLRVGGGSWSPFIGGAGQLMSRRSVAISPAVAIAVA
jgi:hypothetical protein